MDAVEGRGIGREAKRVKEGYPVRLTQLAVSAVVPQYLYSVEQIIRLLEGNDLGKSMNIFDGCKV